MIHNFAKLLRDWILTNGVDIIISSHDNNNLWSVSVDRFLILHHIKNKEDI